MATLKLITFRYLLATLNNKELIHIIDKFIKLCERETIVTSMFNYLHDLSSIDSECMHLSDINESISKLIKSRKRIKSSEPTSSSNHFCVLSSTLIRNIASFLTFKSYITFRDINRKIYISTNSMCDISQSFDFKDLTNYPQNIIKLKNYPNLECIKLNLTKFNEYMPQQKIPRNISKLYICNEMGSMDQVNAFMIDYDEFGEHKLNHIQFLSLHNFEDIDHSFFQCFPTTKHLNLHSVQIKTDKNEQNQETENILKIFSNLKGLTVYDSDIDLSAKLIVNNA